MLGNAIQPELEELITQRRWEELRAIATDFHPADLAEIIIDIPPEDEAVLFRVLPRRIASEVFAHLPTEHREGLVQSLTSEHMRSILEQMTPDDRTHLFEELPAEVTRSLLGSLSTEELKQSRELLGYPPQTAGRYMTPEYVALRADMTAAEALEHVRRTGRKAETLTVLYILDPGGRLLEDLRLGSLVLADADTKVADIDDRPLVAVHATTDREEVLKEFEKYDRFALPVIDDQGHMLGIITADDILDVAAAEATEDIQKIGGMAALDVPYLEAGFVRMIRKRGGWLSVLFLGELLTATAMGHFEHELERALVLAVFIPLIISSGGNTGSQAATLVVRALALEQVRLGDWLRVLGRELGSGVTLGGWLGFLGFLRVVLWQTLGIVDYGAHFLLIGLTIWVSLVGVVTFGTLAGSMLPLMLRRLGLDPATSSAPFVATLVDVTGLIIYFLAAAALLRGTLL
ncbi:MAG: magnesium transporter [Phycisphaerales bacterium]|nr:MAG: magnesium transporter [Phycisphaerales bacterium]